MNLLFRLLLLFFRQWAKLALWREVKLRGVVAYLRAVQGARFGLMGLLAAYLLLQLMMLSFVGALVAGLMLLNADLEFKLQILFAVFATLFVLPAAGLVVLFSERFWYKASGAEKMVDRLND